MFQISASRKNSRDTNHKNVSKRKPKRPREIEDNEEKEFLCNIDPEKTAKFILRLRKGEVKESHRPFNKEQYVQRCNRPTNFQRILDDPCTLCEVEYCDENGPTGQLTGKKPLWVIFLVLLETGCDIYGLVSLNF